MRSSGASSPSSRALCLFTLIPPKTDLSRRSARRNLRRFAAYFLCLLQTCAEFRRNGTLRMGPRRCFAPGPLRNRGSLRRVSGVFWAPPFVSARFCNYAAEKFRRSVAPNVRKAVPTCVPPRLRSQSKMLRTGDYRCSNGVSPSRGGARPPAEPQSTANRRLFLAHSIGRARPPGAPQSLPFNRKMCACLHAPWRMWTSALSALSSFHWELATLALATIPHWQHYAMRQNSALVSCAYIVYTTTILRGACAAREHSPENGTEKFLSY